jgi:hypothetical protein
MAEKDDRVQGIGRAVPAGRPDILRAKDIIPGAQSGGAGSSKDIDIPQFDLANDIMAEHRRLTAVRRKGPLAEDRRQSTEDGKRRTEGRWSSSDSGSAYSAQSYTSQWDPIIAGIVARDIERLCGGDLQPVFAIAGTLSTNLWNK